MDMIGRLEDDDFVPVDFWRLKILDAWSWIVMGLSMLGSFLGLLIYPYFLNGGVGIARVALNSHDVRWAIKKTRLFCFFIGEIYYPCSYIIGIKIKPSKKHDPIIKQPFISIESRKEPRCFCLCTQVTTASSTFAPKPQKLPVPVKLSMPWRRQSCNLIPSAPWVKHGCYSPEN